MAQGLDALTREELIELLEITAKDLIALDGTWFQSLEREQGMDAAMEHDRTAWRRFVPSEARRLKKLLGLSDSCGPRDSPRRCSLRCTSLANEWEIRWEDDGSLAFPHHRLPRAKRPQAARAWTFIPAKASASWNTPAFAAGLDDRIQCECVAATPPSPTTPATALGASGWRDRPKTAQRDSAEFGKFFPLFDAKGRRQRCRGGIPASYSEYR